MRVKQLYNRLCCSLQQAADLKSHFHVFALNSTDSTVQFGSSSQVYAESLKDNLFVSVDVSVGFGRVCYIKAWEGTKYLQRLLFQWLLFPFSSVLAFTPELRPSSLSRKSNPKLTQHK